MDPDPPKASAYTYDYGADAERGIAAANEHLIRDLGEGFKMQGRLEKIGLGEPVVSNQAILMPLALQGDLEVSFGLN